MPDVTFTSAKPRSKYEPHLLTKCTVCDQTLMHPAERHDLIDCIRYRFLDRPRMMSENEVMPTEELAVIQLLIDRVRALENAEQERLAGA